LNYDVKTDFNGEDTDTARLNRGQLKLYYSRSNQVPTGSATRPPGGAMIHIQQRVDCVWSLLSCLDSWSVWIKHGRYLGSITDNSAGHTL